MSAPAYEGVPGHVGADATGGCDGKLATPSATSEKLFPGFFLPVSDSSRKVFFDLFKPLLSFSGVIAASLVECLVMEPDC